MREPQRPGAPAQGATRKPSLRRRRAGESTAGIVFSRIERSRKTDHCSRYRKSSRTRSSKSSSEPARDLPQPGDPRQHQVALLVPLLEPLEVAHRQRPRTDERHLAADHVDELRQLVEREAAQEPPDPRQPRIVADLEQRARLLVERLEVVLDLVGVLAHRAELEARERLAADPGPHRAVDRRAARAELDASAITSSTGESTISPSDRRRRRSKRPLERVVDPLEHRRAQREQRHARRPGRTRPGRSGSPSSTARPARSRRARGRGRRARPPVSWGKAGSAMITSWIRSRSSTSADPAAVRASAGRSRGRGVSEM